MILINAVIAPLAGPNKKPQIITGKSDTSSFKKPGAKGNEKLNIISTALTAPMIAIVVICFVVNFI